MKQFREQLKQEAKLLKQEVEVLPRSDRKDALKRRRDMLDAEHMQRVILLSLSFSCIANVRMS